MLLKRIEMENFGPYYGSQVITLKGETDELVLIHGENMAGKTSLLNAIRWCLYGEAKDRAGAAMPTVKLINSDALDEGTKRVSVTLDIVHRDGTSETPVRLKRQRQAKRDIVNPTVERDFTLHLDVDLDGDILPSDQFDDIVNTMLPERISRFFLFDGELLKEYEELVHEDSTTHARQVQRAIEMILGVPAAQNGKDDLTALHNEASRAYNREARKHTDIEESAKAADALQDDVDSLQAELETLHPQQDDASADLRRVRDELAKHEHLADSANALTRAEERTASLKEQREAKQQRRRDLARDLWRDVLEPRLHHEIDNLERDRQQIGSALRDKGELERELAERQSALSGKKCATCDQPIPEDLRLRQKARIDEIQERLSGLAQTADQERHDQLGATIRRMREIAPAGVASGIKEIEHDLSQIVIDLHKTERERSDAEADLRGFDKEVVPAFEEKRNHLLKHLGHVEQSIKDTEETLTEKRSALRNHQRAMKEKDEPTLRHLRIQRDLLASAATVYDASIGDLIDDLRGDVEEQASEIFRELTTDKTYAGLQINENYGLTILDSNGKTVPVRSAGAEQIVALSFIGALNRLASRRGPVIMDTPFGRLDRRHRENILRFVPTLADQVALLVHSGEIDPARDLEPVKGNISSEYEIRHVESARSEIVGKAR